MLCRAGSWAVGRHFVLSISIGLHIGNSGKRETKFENGEWKKDTPGDKCATPHFDIFTNLSYSLLLLLLLLTIAFAEILSTMQIQQHKSIRNEGALWTIYIVRINEGRIRDMREARMKNSRSNTNPELPLKAYTNINKNVWNGCSATNFPSGTESKYGEENTATRCHSRCHCHPSASAIERKAATNIISVLCAKIPNRKRTFRPDYTTDRTV